MPGDKCFLDTNILVYAFDVSAGRKHEVAKKIVIDLWDTKDGILSTQVLQELFVSVTRKITKTIDAGLAREIVSDLFKWDIVINDKNSLLEAIDIHIRYGHSFWDSLQIQAAIRSGAALLLTENLTDSQEIKSISIKNPFKHLVKSS
jgi:predicted nucleic acid-binding protein